MSPLISLKGLPPEILIIFSCCARSIFSDMPLGRLSAASASPIPIRIRRPYFERGWIGVRTGFEANLERIRNGFPLQAPSGFSSGVPEPRSRRFRSGFRTAASCDVSLYPRLYRIYSRSGAALCFGNVVRHDSVFDPARLYARRM